MWGRSTKQRRAARKRRRLAELESMLAICRAARADPRFAERGSPLSFVRNLAAGCEITAVAVYGCAGVE